MKKYFYLTILIILSSINFVHAQIKTNEDLNEFNAFVKKIYKSDNNIYLDIDIVLVKYYPDGTLKIINNNPKIRTYIVDENSYILTNKCEKIKHTELIELREKLLKLKDNNIITIGETQNGKIITINFGCYG